MCGGRRLHQKKQQHLAPAGGRAGSKRRSRASKRAPTTYISTDPANFRLMVQHVTGAQQAADDDLPLQLGPGGAATDDDVAAALLLGAADTDASAAAGADGGYYGGTTTSLLLPPPGTCCTGYEPALLLHHQQQQQQPCFPTLDSWNVSSMHMYDDSSDLL